MRVPYSQEKLSVKDLNEQSGKNWVPGRFQSGHEGDEQSGENWVTAMVQSGHEDEEQASAPHLQLTLELPRTLPATASSSRWHPTPSLKCISLRLSWRSPPGPPQQHDTLYTLKLYHHFRNFTHAIHAHNVHTTPGAHRRATSTHDGRYRTTD